MEYVNKSWNIVPWRALCTGRSWTVSEEAKPLQQDQGREQTSEGIDELRGHWETKLARIIFAS
jgi:hypothetical protein